MIIHPEISLMLLLHSYPQNLSPDILEIRKRQKNLRFQKKMERAIGKEQRENVVAKVQRRGLKRLQESLFKV